MKESLAKLTIWRTTLPNVKHGLLPPSIPRPNPLVVDSSIFVSVFAPGAIVCLRRDTGVMQWRRDLPPLGAASAHFAGGKLFAKTSHTLYALAPESGRELWRFCPYGTTGEWIYSNPIVSRNRLFIGDRRGVLHCLDANSGKHLWSAQTNRKNADVNSTPLVLDGLVVVGTNARTAAAFDTANGRRVWKRNLNGPAVFGLLRHRDMVVVVTESIYLLSPGSGNVEKHLRWRKESVDYVENFGGRLAAVLRDRSSNGTSRISVCDVVKGAVNTVSHDVWCPTLRYVPETRMAYVSHLNGLRLLDANANTLTDIAVPDEGVGVVDVRDGTIYVATGRGRVFAIRHPVVR
ncbi:MAG TPA: PQQ-binding-like beta-propeller repeat protein [Terriglobales bacterium]|jgi:outer membrane protein assembly factor BamB|nr:PQQ-binding-like beta-propeller repeat protein [Terriglobales bacterium]